jgi:hypothetical protein
MSNLAIFVLVLVSVAKTFSGDSPMGIINGRIVDEVEHAPISNVYILLHGSRGPEDVSTRSMSDGSYSMTIGPGVYDIFVSLEPFQPVCHWVRIEAGKTVSLDLTLKANNDVLEELGLLRVPAVVFRGNCANNQTGFNEWFHGTRLPYGEPYLSSAARKQQITGRYSKLKLNMSLEEVKLLLGDPDFSTSLPKARLASRPPSEEGCATQVAYILKKTSENMTDTADVAIYMFFTPEGRLYWAAPQNLPDLRPFGSPN